MSKKVILAKDGYNALTETDLRNLAIHSDYNTLKYFTSGVVEVARSGTTASGEIAHNLGYVPFFIAYANWVPLETQYAQCPIFIAGGPAYTYVGAWADSSKIYFTIESNVSPASSYTTRFAYKIFRNSLGL